MELCVGAWRASHPLPTKRPRGAIWRQTIFLVTLTSFAWSLELFGRCTTVLKGLRWMRFGQCPTRLQRRSSIPPINLQMLRHEPCIYSTGELPGFLWVVVLVFRRSCKRASNPFESHLICHFQASTRQHRRSRTRVVHVLLCLAVHKVRWWITECCWRGGGWGGKRSKQAVDP
jgi:hypothetical protein